MTELLDLLFGFFGLNRGAVADQAGNAGQLIDRLERLLGIPHAIHYYLLLLAGLALCFWGRKLYWVLVFISGAVLGAIIGLIVSAGAAGGGLVFALLGGVLAMVLQQLFNFILGGLLLGIALVLALPNPLAFLFGFVIGGIIAVNIFRFLIILLSAIKGALLAGSSVRALMAPVPSLQPLRDIRELFSTLQHFLSTGQLPAASGPEAFLGLAPATWGLVIGILCFVSGLWYQLRAASRSRGPATTAPDTTAPVIADQGATESGSALPHAQHTAAAPGSLRVVRERPQSVAAVPRVYREPPGSARTGQGASAISSPWTRRRQISPASASGQTDRADAGPPAAARLPAGPPPGRSGPQPGSQGGTAPEPVPAVRSHQGRGISAGSGVLAATVVVMGGAMLIISLLPGSKDTATTAEPVRAGQPPAGAFGMPPSDPAPNSSAGSAPLEWPATLQPAPPLPIPSDRCAVIIASRQSVEEARAVLRVHDAESLGAVYRARNGWYAVSAGVLPRGGATAAIAAMVGRGLVPDDALCSAGQSYVSRVWP